MNIFTTIKDLKDEKVTLVINCKTIDEMASILTAIEKAGNDRIKHQLDAHKGTFIYELSMPKNRYFAFIKALHHSGWDLKSNTNIGLVNEVVRK